MRPSPARPVVCFGEAMIELSSLSESQARLGVAGDSFNTAVGLARRRLPVSYLTALGTDHFSEVIARRMEEERISSGLVLRAEGSKPGLYAISLDENRERSFTYWRSDSAARQLFRMPGIEDCLALATEASVLYLTGITLALFTEAERSKVLWLIREVGTRGGMVVFDPNYRPSLWSSPDEAIKAFTLAAPHAHTVLPTFDDEALLFGDQSPADTAKRWSELGAGFVVVKCGASPALLSDGDRVPPEETIDPVDTSGAGDAFNAGYITGVLEGKQPAEAVSDGHRAAAAALRCEGAIPPIEKRD
ncbi:sugar kinase [Parvularcula maris]|uniref:Sugar kinase n=1 Tax=Parvularcula maris TaxID=2965077 RepID=A0A9X2RII3_9PROT|nr:sugar kinase [Parvularcula maris]